jgi:hypothetical protein
LKNQKHLFDLFCGIKILSVALRSQKIWGESHTENNISFLGLKGSLSYVCKLCTLIKKVNQIFLIYKEIQSGAAAKSYMRKGFLIYEEMRKYFPIYEENLIFFALLCKYV